MSLILEVKVLPNSGRSAFSIDSTGRLKAHLKSPPIDGKANKELLMLLAKALGCPQSDLSILSGLTSRIKRIKIMLPLTREEVLNKLGCAVQMSLIY